VLSEARQSIDFKGFIVSIMFDDAGGDGEPNRVIHKPSITLG
jgi:hypothetical protein